MVKPIPDGYHTVTPYLTVKGASDAIEFYKRAFGAEEAVRMTSPDGNAVLHAEIRIGDSIVMLGEEMPAMETASPATLGGTSGGLMLYVADVDATLAKAVEAGATVIMPATNMFWGDRYGRLKDPFGHSWSIATHVEDVAPEEMDRRTREWLAKAASSDAA